MILTDESILAAIGRGSIVIEPFDRERLGSNSYDLCLSKHVAVYSATARTFPDGDVTSYFINCLDAKEDNAVSRVTIGSDGLLLRPGVLYLCSTEEYTDTTHDPVFGHLIPDVSGKSSVGRLGIAVEVSAGWGDAQFRGFWTLELVVVHPVRVYAGMPIAQIRYQQAVGDVLRPYGSKPGANYQNRDPLPQASRMWKNFMK